MKNTRKILALALALVMACGCLVPAFAQCEHNWQWRVSKAPTCGEAGTQYQYCTLCGATQNEGTVVEPTGEHSLIWVIDVAPTCGAQGKEHQECTVCGAILNENTPIQATGDHTYKWVVDKEATCGAAGLKHRECSVCGAWETPGVQESIPHTNVHTWVWVLDTDHMPTCGQTGLQFQQCTVCGAKQNEGTLAAATGEHVWDGGTVVRQPSCSHTGIMKYVCTVCGNEKAVDFEDLPYELRPAEMYGDHNWNAGVVTISPTCVKEGTVEYTCVECGEKQTQSVAKLAHVDGDGDGQCDRCGSTIGNGTNTGVSLKSIYDRIVDFFWGIWVRIRSVFTGEVFK